MRPRSLKIPMLSVMAAAILLFSAPGQVQAQATMTAPTITGFVQTGWHAQASNDPIGGGSSITPPSPSVGHGFFVSTARLYFDGEVGDGLAYSVRTEMIGSFGGVLEAKAIYALNDAWTVSAGRMLKPFGRDRLRPRHMLLSLERSLGSRVLVNGLMYGSYDVGAMAAYSPDGGMDLMFGMFNGEPYGTTVDTDTGKNIVGRAVLPLSAFELGINVSYQHISSFASDARGHMAYGVDGLYESGPMLVEFELLQGDDPDGTSSPPTDRGINLTFGYDLAGLLGARSSRFVVRADQYDPDTDVDDDELLTITPSLDLVISDASRFQIGLVYEDFAAPGADAGMSLVVLWQVNFF